MGGMPRAGVVDVPGGGAPTPAPPAKIAALADLLRRLDPDEVEPAVGFLVGEPRQGRIGVGWATLARRVAARRDALAAGPRADEAGTEAPAITIGELDRALDELGATTGAGSVAARA